MSIVKDSLIIVLFFTIWAGLVYYNTPPIKDVQMGWIQISNRIGKVGATVFSDGDDPNLMNEYLFKNQPKVVQVVEVNTLTAFINKLEESGVKIVYLHEDALIFIKDSTTWISYTPIFYHGPYRFIP
jgi:S-adenosylmethionine:diacylglycerol 3-amino-3-carboxypropyl transferase